MPLEEALSLVDRDFQCYTIDVREGRIPPRRQKNELSSLLSQAASGGQLSTEQLQQVIEALQKQKQQSNGRLQTWTHFPPFFSFFCF